MGASFPSRTSDRAAAFAICDEHAKRMPAGGKMRPKTAPFTVIRCISHPKRTPAPGAPLAAAQFSNSTRRDLFKDVLHASGGRSLLGFALFLFSRPKNRQHPRNVPFCPVARGFPGRLCRYGPAWPNSARRRVVALQNGPTMLWNRNRTDFGRLDFFEFFGRYKGFWPPRQPIFACTHALPQANSTGTGRRCPNVHGNAQMRCVRPQPCTGRGFEPSLGDLGFEFFSRGVRRRLAKTRGCKVQCET